MQLKLLIFDFDGTLADTIALCVQSLQSALYKHTGRRYSHDEIVGLFGISEEGIIRQLAGEAEEACSRDFLNYYRNNHGAHGLFSGIEDLLTAALERGLHIAMVTGKGAGSAAISVKHLQLDRFFEIIRTGSADRDIKTDHILDICSQLQLLPSSAAYIGDAPSDMRVAREAGAMAIAALWSETVPRDRLLKEKPDLQFETVQDLHRWVETI